MKGVRYLFDNCGCFIYSVYRYIGAREGNTAALTAIITKDVFTLLERFISITLVIRYHDFTTPFF